MIDAVLREFLGACVRAEKNIMIAGKQKAGKTPVAGDAEGVRPAVPFATVQSEDELFAHDDGYHRQAVSLIAGVQRGEGRHRPRRG